MYQFSLIKENPSQIVDNRSVSRKIFSHNIVSNVNWELI